MLIAQGSKLNDWLIKTYTIDQNVTPCAIDLGNTAIQIMTPTGTHCKVSYLPTLYTVNCL